MEYQEAKYEGIIDTLRVMLNHKIRRVPVLCEVGSLFSMVTADDLINSMPMELSIMTDSIADQLMREA